MDDIDRTAFQQGSFASLFVGLYGWLLAVSFGAIVLDVVYSRAIEDIPDSAQTARIFSIVADFLLLPLIAAALAALGAIAFASRVWPARNLIVASVVVMFAAIPVYALLGPMLDGLKIGAWVRLALSGGASVLAIAGMISFYRAK